MGTQAQAPIAVVGLSCRLPGNSNSPDQFWKFLLDGKIAGLAPPPSRFRLEGHYDGTLRPWTMRSPGGMFIDADPSNIDAGFFGLSQVDATSMDPQQRQLLEVVYEGLENAGLTMEALKSKAFGCFVGSYASDYSDVQTRDPEDRVPSFTVGCGRAMLSNRISHFLDIKGPSMTIDTACSGSLISVDLACRYLESGDAEGAIVAGCNLYMSPEHNMDQSAMTSAASPTGRCWTFDARADGYIKAEAINCLILKRLEDAVRDGDPIRAVIRGTSTNSDGWTPGIASPSAEAQSLAIRRAYARAGITDFNDTAYLECHGTGTLAGDPIECKAASSVFSQSRPAGLPLRIGSVKSNIGHSEPAAGISGMLKTVLAVDRGVIPGNPTFDIPNPAIDFEAYKILPSKVTTPWPQGMLRRASVNSFGYGGSNAHAILEHPASLIPGYECASVTSYATPFSDFDLLGDQDIEDHITRLLVFSANDEGSLKAYVKECIRHLSDPAVKLESADLEYTLAHRRTRHFFRAYAVTNGTKLRESQVSYGKLGKPPRIGFVFTGQGAQWPQMGRDLLERFPVARITIQSLDEALQSMSEPPSWSLARELCDSRTTEHMRSPIYSQPLVTALQLALLAVLKKMGIEPSMVVGHSSGEIAAAVAAGYLTPQDGIKVAYLRGKAAADFQASLSQNKEAKLGMLAVGLGPIESLSYMASYPDAEIACKNSSKSVTISGPVQDLEALQDVIKSDGHFARLLLVDLAYHSKHMKSIAEHYGVLLQKYCPALTTSQKSENTNVAFFSTVDGAQRGKATSIEYWVENMVSPVLFDEGVTALIQSQGGSDIHLIELGPSGALAGPITQIKQALSQGASVEYSTAIARGNDPTRLLHELAGKLFFRGIDVDVAAASTVQTSTGKKPRVIVDLPNYQWNHSVKYWHESLASKDWRYRSFPSHDLLGSRILGTSWSVPTFRRILRLKDVPWIRDHTLGTEVVFPASGYIAMAIEAVYQMAKASGAELLLNTDSISQTSYRLRDVRLLRAMVVEEDAGSHVYLTLSPFTGQDMWFQFTIKTLRDDTWTEHCRGLVRIDSAPVVSMSTSAATRRPAPLSYPSPAKLWYKSMYNVGFHFGPTFQNLIEIESTAGKRTNRARVQFPHYPERTKESQYTIHPSVFDSFFQAGIPSLYQGHRTLIDRALVPRLIDEITINPGAETPKSVLAEAESLFVTGRHDKTENYKSNIVIYNEDSGAVLSEIRGLHYTELDIPTSIAKTTRKVQNFMKIGWKADIAMLGNGVELDQIAGSEDTTVLSAGLRLPPIAALLVSLLMHKVACPSVVDLDMLSVGGGKPELESDITKQDESSLALEYYLSTLRRYSYVSSTPEHLATIQPSLKNIPGAEFHIHDITSSASGEVPFDTGSIFDLVLLRMPTTGDKAKSLGTALSKAHELCNETGYLILVQPRTLIDDVIESSSECSADSEPGVFISWSSYTEAVLQSSGFTLLAKSTPSENTATSSDVFSTVYLCTRRRGQIDERQIEKNQSARHFSIVDFSKASLKESSALIQSLRNLGWTGDIVEALAASKLPLENPILLIDDPRAPLLATIGESDWAGLTALLKAGRRILWLTSGSQLSVSSPSNALIHGFARSLRGEEPTLDLKVLDLSSYTGENAAKSTLRVMEKMNPVLVDGQHIDEKEYCEHGGRLYVSRVTLDENLAEAALVSKEGGETEETWLRKNPRTVKLWCERLGALGSIRFNEIPDEFEPETFGDSEVEVEIRAAGLNFKDVVVSLGVVPEDEHLLGHEGAGIITRVGSKVSPYRVGDRVVVHTKGAFGNRARVPKENVFLIPQSVSFEEGATMSVAFFTAVYGLMEIGQIKRGQTILIHSAAGGVGCASIQICRYLGVNIFATAGNEEKRRFLSEEYGIPSDRIFDSRNRSFAEGIRTSTGGRGVDFVLNFLTGDLLDESWRLLADNGTLLEIGKKDIVDRNALPMEPFDRNCSYRGIDISKPSVLNDLPLVERVLQTIRKLLVVGHIKPIAPRKVFTFDKIPDAIRYMRSGEHIGKIVISNTDAEDVKVPIRRAAPSLRFDPKATYLIIGGLKGLCGSLAVYMARCGAKSITVMSRSGADDGRSRQVIEDARSLGAEVDIVRGDVSLLADVRKMFIGSKRPIRGVIQGAMVLRDKTLETMTLEEYHEALECKHTGTWNLHRAAAEQQGINLDFFTMLSSVSGVVGTASQANYAAGNTFQDAFALYRHSLGLAAHSINLGIIEDVGYMSQNEGLSDRVQSRSGLSQISELQLHEILKLSILRQTIGLGLQGRDKEAGQMITGLPFPLPEDSPLLEDVRFRSLLAPHISEDNDQKRPMNEENDNIRVFQAMVKASLPIETLVSEAIKLVNKQLVRALGLAADVESSKSLSSYGIDSLAAVDLRNWFKMRLGAALTTLDVLNATNLQTLCLKVVERLLETMKA
ncbi:hypothetical protein F4779DRAFT_638417 [Xylariaceae sp. FL0662B]|nr:hypothetical protein F4779DRAFT_638417 [Xylariaceae sp. FL0662B]